MSPRCVKTLAMIVSLGIRRLPLTSMSSMIWPVWAEAWDATGKPDARRTAASDTHLAMEISFKLPLGNRNITTLRTVWENSDYTELTAPAPLARSISPLLDSQFRCGRRTSSLRTLQIPNLADFILKNNGKTARIVIIRGIAKI